LVSFGVITSDAGERNWTWKDVEMNERLLTRAAEGDEDAFRELTEPYDRELQFHCYRILGSMHDAEEAVQETMLRAWRGLGRFEQRASLRAWLYRIATNRCLDTLRDASRRPPPALGTPFAAPPPTRFAEPTWLEPYPDVLLEGVIDATPGPEARYEKRETIQLAFIAALQALPPRQRAVLVLRDVLGFHTTEVADMLDSTDDSIKSALKRARATLVQRTPSPDHDAAPLPDSPCERELVQRFTDAWETDDIDGIVALLTEDAWLRMPPSPLEYQGANAIGAFLQTLAMWRSDQRVRLIATRANTQPAFGVYNTDPHAPIAHASGLIVLTLEGGRIAAITAFVDTSVLPRFGLPRTLAL
jgi:RNA polymerase sigma-70 factor (TIGR02960 family)